MEIKYTFTKYILNAILNWSSQSRLTLTYSLLKLWLIVRSTEIITSSFRTTVDVHPQSAQYPRIIAAFAPWCSPRSFDEIYAFAEPFIPHTSHQIIPCLGYVLLGVKDGTSTRGVSYDIFLGKSQNYILTTWNASNQAKYARGSVVVAETSQETLTIRYTTQY